MFRVVALFLFVGCGCGLGVVLLRCGVGRRVSRLVGCGIGLGIRDSVVCWRERGLVLGWVFRGGGSVDLGVGEEWF